MGKKESTSSLFSRLTRLFRSGPVVKRKIRALDTTVAMGADDRSSGVVLLQKSAMTAYASITGNAYNITDRFARYQDFQEMEYTPELCSALDIYADETVAQDEKGRVLHIYSDNQKIQEILENLFYDTLNIDFNLRPWVRNACKYGDTVLCNDISAEHGVLNVFPIPINEIEREENFDKADPFAVRYRWNSLGSRFLENWEVTHFRLLGNDLFLPYGTSVLEAARRIWRQLILIEDAMLVYRITRAPERRVFYFDVGNMPAANVPAAAEELRHSLKTNQVIDSRAGRVDLRYNPMSVDEDYIIPVRGKESGTKIDTLAGGQNTAAVEDVEYIQKKLFAALKIPRAYLGYDEMLSSKATLAQEDIRFSRTIGIIQKTIIAELNKIAIIHLFAHGFSNDDLLDFTLRLSNPSTIAQQQKLELWRAKFEIAGSAPEGMIDKNFIRREILGLTNEQCLLADKNRLDEKLIDQAIDSAEPTPDGDGDNNSGNAGGESLFGDETSSPPLSTGEDLSDTDMGGAENDDTADEPADVNAGEDADEESDPTVELLTSADDQKQSDAGAPLRVPLSKISAPITVKSHMKRYAQNQARHRTHGASKTHIPDFRRMLDSSNVSFVDPHDMKSIRAVVSDPLGENHLRRRGLSNDTRAMLEQMAKRLNTSALASPSSMIAENAGRDVQREIELGLPIQRDI